MTSAPDAAATPDRRTLVRKAIPRLAILAAVFAAALFLPAGTFNWPSAWVLMGLTVGNSALALWSMDPDLMQERLGAFKRKPGAKTWDLALLILMAHVVPVGTFVVSGLDHRFGWSAVPVALQIAAVVAMLPALALIHWAMRTNRFFSAVVRIQRERGHTVVTGGPYAYVRHPGYAGMIVYVAAMPALLASWWAFIPAALAIGLVLLRTTLEDRTLRTELDGYKEYAGRVRYRLVPGLW